MANAFTKDFVRRLKEIKTTRWIRFTLVALIYIAWVIWMQSWWLLIFLFLLFDIYITGYINFTWWKTHPNKIVRTIMSWVDALVYALVLVYFIFAFIGQNYVIPSSSLEKTLLTGDYLWVNKMVYGPRVPMTPVNFPLVHNKIFGIKSYLDSPSNSYRRLKGLRSVEEGDIVVFNFPMADTVATKYEESAWYYDMLIKEYGREEVLRNPDVFGEIVYRPVDRRQNFVKRAVGLPGQSLRISNDSLYIDGQFREFPKSVQYNYLFATTRVLTDNDYKELGIQNSDIGFIAPNSQGWQVYSTFLPAARNKVVMYIAPLTQQMLTKLSDEGILAGAVKYSRVQELLGLDTTSYIFPYGSESTWTLVNYGGDDGLLIPAKGMKISLTYDNWVTYHRCIRNYEGHSNSWWDTTDGVAYIDGKRADEYVFAMDYYFMMGDNRDNSQDSRFWGFVPEDHIVGTPMIVLCSFDQERSLFDGKIRWNRIFRDANPDK